MNKTREDQVREFHEVFLIPINEVPTAKLLQSRRSLIEEEVNELMEDIDEAIDLLEQGKKIPTKLYANMLKELADVQIVISGTSVTLKPLRNLEEAFQRVCVSNMSKLGPDGNPILREDGKVVKGPHYEAPNLSDLVS